MFDPITYALCSGGGSGGNLYFDLRHLDFSKGEVKLSYADCEKILVGVLGMLQSGNIVPILAHIEIGAIAVFACSFSYSEEELVLNGTMKLVEGTVSLTVIIAGGSGIARLDVLEN